MTKRFLAVLLLMSLSAVAQEKPQRFSKSKFWTEAVAYSLANAGDGYTTVSTTGKWYWTTSDGKPMTKRRKETTAPWLYGTYPSPLRYSIASGGIQFGTMLLSYHLQHSQSRTLRVIGHSLMAEGIAVHSYCSVQNNLRH